MHCVALMIHQSSLLFLYISSLPHRRIEDFSHIAQPTNQQKRRYIAEMKTSVH